MQQHDYEEIIALSEDPNVTYEEVRGRPPTPQELERVALVADDLFCGSDRETQVEFVRSMPPSVSARRLALLPDHERAVVLSRVAADLAEEISSLLPVGVP